MNGRRAGLPVTLVLALLSLPADARAQFEEPPAPAAYALTDVAVVGADGGRRDGVTLVVRGAFIEAIGPGAAVPEDALVLDGESLTVYPGLVDAHGGARVEFPPVDRQDVQAWNASRAVQGFTPHRTVADYLRATGDDVAGARRQGVVAAAVLPGGGPAPGQASVLLLRPGAETPWELVVDPAFAPVLGLRGSRGSYPSTLFGVIAFLRQAFEDAGHQERLAQAYGRDPRGVRMPTWDPDYEVLRRAAAGEVPVLFLADEAEDIRRVLGLADEFGFRPVIVGGGEAWKVADELRRREVPVLVSLDFPEPDEWDPDDEAAELEPAAAREREDLVDRYANAGRLAGAGVRFALTSGGGEADLREGARTAIEHGLSPDAALRALTAVPAGILGIPAISRLQERGSATFLVADGDLFDEETGVLYTFVEGVLERGRATRPSAAGEGEEPAADLTGTWEIVFDEAGIPRMVAEITQEAGELTGTVTVPAMPGAEAFRIEAGRIAGTDVSFRFEGEGFPGVTLEGTLEDERIEGRASGPRGSADFTMTRTPGGDRGGER